ncbi:MULTISPECIES: prolyl oligopeptidase family serine peptidase [Alteromonas]|uniref:prolyl oligopeptidase family serine peptidase n=1 Tax=Alteromonas TaxID=226 RepID=UPI00126AA147|nr:MULTISPECIES: prolyl oligopeptidase family serine peptidase [Alteromonas]CAI2390302.1 prolyl oligopeptidase Serine peptidase. MEROPS family S09A [Alteromonas macleodii]CAI3959266.1 prolyl oligopeptidase Serine peptidase. MEROPS family S09A [Alteromonas macleodii]CAI3960184.1 prolyl oligopeptidase Serine peptidase. MEROPS family S09A [Alteromonas macleodii]CAI3960214.1 prolyl oligopeptidase Serine peptidase. MEROPS family S09A [Alteromonas macleodii]VTO39898.1 prolyl oligopeptidase Serine pe
MKKNLIYAAIVAASAGLTLACTSSYTESTSSVQGESQSGGMPKVSDYPETKTVTQQDNYHGTVVSDPYRWLEEEKSEEVSAWVESQNTLARPYLAELPSRERYKERLTALWDYEKYSTPYMVNGKLFYSYNDGLQNQYVLYMADGVNGKPEVLIDPNTLSEDGTVSMASTELSPKASLLAYMLSDGGTDWKTIHVRDTSNRSDLTDIIKGIKFSNIAWLPDESGFFYSRYPQNEAGKYDDSQTVSIYFHAIGTAQSEDKKVFAFDNKPTWNPYPSVVQDGKTLLISVFEGYQANGVYAKSLVNDDSELVSVFDKWDGRYDLIGEHDDELFFTSTANAPTGKVIKVDFDDGVKATETVIESTSDTLSSVSLLGEKLFAQYLKDVKGQVSVFDLNGKKIDEIAFNDIGSVSGFYGSKNADTTFYKLTGFTNPGQVFAYDVKSGESSLFKSIDTGVNYDDYETKQIFYTSKDGTKVPMFIVHKKGLKLDGNNKTLLYGYGGFNISLLPRYSVSRMVWVEQGNVLAIANLRGGGEYGQQWHKAGTKLDKQNVFDDFIAAGEYLVESGYTTPEKMGIQGGSNGGLLVGATLTQRPDLFSAALPAVGVLDMLRYHTPSANARAWSSDYGLSENKDEFEALYAYSPLHNTKPGTCYPATLVTTGDHDDRVVPWHSYKFAAQLQADQSCDNPILLRVETRAGHGAGTPTWMQIEGYADQWAFLESALN